MAEHLSLRMVPILFYSELDESLLWNALQSRPYISDLELVDEGYAFSIDRSQLDWGSFKDVMALYLRYGGDLRTLVAICPDEEVRSWFVDPARDWHGQLGFR